MFRIFLVTIILFCNHVFAEEIIEPVSAKKALIYLPFQSDFDSDVGNIILALLPNFTVTVISNKDVIVNVGGRDQVFPAVNFDLQILENYILKLNEYDFIYFDSHANLEMISLGIPAPNKNLCKKPSSYSIECELFGNTIGRMYIDSNREDFYSTQRIQGEDHFVSYSMTPSFFTDNFTGENKFRNTIFVSDTCSNTEGDFPEVLTSDEVGISLFTGWEGTIYNEDIYRTTFPFLQKMMNGDTSKEAIKDIITDVRSEEHTSELQSH